MKILRITLFFFLFIVLSIVVSAGIETITIQNRSYILGDTYVEVSKPNTNYATEIIMYVGGHEKCSSFETMGHGQMVGASEILKLLVQLREVCYE